jgi:5-methylcytosine-specific restriction endonuclease McrA
MRSDTGKRRTNCCECEQKRKAMYYRKNRKNILLRVKKYNIQNIHKRRKYLNDNAHYLKRQKKIYHDLHKDEEKAYRVKFYRKHRKRLIRLQVLARKRKYKNDIVFRLRHLVSCAIGKAIKKNGKSFINRIGYSVAELKIHLESRFEPWMNWNNYGTYNAFQWDDSNVKTWTWQIDHIIPQSSLPYTSMTDDNFKKCWALRNLRPYSSKQNILDGDRR